CTSTEHVYASFMSRNTTDFLNSTLYGQPGYYTSWLVSTFTVGNIISTYAWGYFADRFGRKPVMVFGLFACGVLSITFGLSTTFAEAMVSR
ncbi:unnamed protein product, partial [Scytosiphon promiscuus]